MIFNGKQIEGGFTYRKQNVEISQLDWALCTQSMIQHVEDFRICKNSATVSDHYALKLLLTVIKAFSSADLCNRKAHQLGVSHTQTECAIMKKLCISRIK